MSAAHGIQIFAVPAGLCGRGQHSGRRRRSEGHGHVARQQRFLPVQRRAPAQPVLHPQLHPLLERGAGPIKHGHLYWSHDPGGQRHSTQRSLTSTSCDSPTRPLCFRHIWRITCGTRTGFRRSGRLCAPTRLIPVHPSWLRTQTTSTKTDTPSRFPVSAPTHHICTLLKYFRQIYLLSGKSSCILDLFQPFSYLHLRFLSFRLILLFYSQMITRG